MFHFTIFAATEARLTTQGFTALTLFGVTELIRPTFAKRVMSEAEHEPEPQGWFDKIRADNSNVILTIFGSTELRHPSLIEEYTALRSLVTSGAISKQDLSNRLQIMFGQDNKEGLTSITVFGVFEDGAIGRNQQLKALASAEKAGLISREHKRRLDEAVDAPDTGMRVLGSLVPEMA